MSPKEKIQSLKKHLEKVENQRTVARSCDPARMAAHKAWVELELKRTQKKIDELTLALPTGRS